ncbi:prephenate dehydrogenase [Lentibacillus lipolyticus]|nr:prephenate dehydrogenase [Lentibacillus lipolyticus]
MIVRTIFVIGLGLIGGSLAKCFAKSETNHVIGYDIDQQTMDFARINGIIDEASSAITTAANKADYIILGTPISETIELMQTLDTITFDRDVIISDVSSVKKPVMEAAYHLQNSRIKFIGGHPMAGSHKKGIKAAKEHLFENAIYVLTPAPSCQTQAVWQLQGVLEDTKSNIIELQPNEHDEMTAVISHFPHLVASALVHQANKWQETHAFIPQLAAGGFRDVTRIASSSPELWQDIFYHNRQKMVHLIDEWTTEMTALKQILMEHDKEQLTSYLWRAKKYRDGLGAKEKGAIPSFYDLYVDIRDQTGAIASVANLLAEENVSITNIQILEIREGITGALRLSVSTKEEQQKSYQLLQDKGYELMLEE